ncbi:PREDICTED: urocortin-2 [Chinchilla lanigera]|uniref:urocortin-2 n=1 Tax=Chinchilla lanigera TaxID=34839 RepID=UPI0006975795|nr:PREDICTED: urocortin-2 [Chinchilla lanigera]
MTRWAPWVLTVLTSARVLAVPVTPSPASQILPQNCSQTTPCPVASVRPSAPTILLDQAQTRAAREQAAANAHILAHVGRR